MFIRIKKLFHWFEWLKAGMPDIYCTDCCHHNKYDNKCQAMTFQGSGYSDKIVELTKFPERQYFLDVRFVRQKYCGKSAFYFKHKEN